MKNILANTLAFQTQRRFLLKNQRMKFKMITPEKFLLRIRKIIDFFYFLSSLIWDNTI